MDEFLTLAVDAARAAGASLLDRFRAPATGVGTKSSGTDMVSDADRAAETLILELIGARRPDDAVLGEETGASKGSSGIRWIVDPLDGTTNFLYGIGHWAVSVACEDEQGALAGVVFDPVRDELFSAARDGRARLNGDPIAVSGQEDLSRALVATGFAYEPEQRAAAARMLEPLLPAVRDIRRAGAAALDLAWVAAGRVDAYVEIPIAPWDVAAGQLLVTAAGGRAERFQHAGDEGSVACTPGLEAPLRALLDRILPLRTAGRA